MPYNGTASYYNIKTEDGFYKDAVWRYRNPKPEFEKIRDFVAFYSELAEVTEAWNVLSVMKDELVSMPRHWIPIVNGHFALKFPQRVPSPYSEYLRA